MTCRAMNSKPASVCRRMTSPGKSYSESFPLLPDGTTAACTATVRPGSSTRNVSAMTRPYIARNSSGVRTFEWSRSDDEYW